MNKLNKVAITLFIGYVFVMILGVLQDFTIHSLRENDVVIVNRTTSNDHSSVDEIKEKIKEMAKQNNYCLYNTKSENNITTYHFLDKYLCNEFIDILENHIKMDIDNNNLLQISKEEFLNINIQNLFVYNGKNIFDETNLPKYDLNNYAVAFLEHHNDVIAFIQRYLVLLSIFCIVAIILIYFDLYSAKKRLYLSNLYGITFISALLNSKIKKSFCEFIIASVVSVIILKGFFNFSIHMLYASFGFSLFILILCYGISIIFLYHKYKSLYYQVTFNLGNKSLFVMIVLYCLIFTIFLRNIVDIVNDYQVRQTVISTISRYNDTYTIDNIPAISMDKRKQYLSDLQNKGTAIYIADNSTIGGYTVNLSYVEIFVPELIEDQDNSADVIIFVSRKDEIFIKKYQEQSQNEQMDNDIQLIIYETDITIETFDLFQPISINPILVLEKEVFASENGYFFTGYTMNELEIELAAILKKNEINFNHTLNTYGERYNELLISMTSTIQSLIILASCYILSCLYFISIIITELFYIERKKIILKIFFGNNILVATKKIVRVIFFGHSLATIISLSIGNGVNNLILLVISIILLIVEFIIIIGYLLYLVKKNIPIFLKGEE